MYLPNVDLKQSKTRRQTVAFGGLNYTENARDGELSDSRGLSLAAYPALTQRKGRTSVGEDWHLQGSNTALWAAGKLCWINTGSIPTGLYYDGAYLGGLEQPGKAQLALVNTKLCVFPEGKYADLTEEAPTLKPMEASGSTLEHSVRFTEDAVILLGKRPVLERREYTHTDSSANVSNYYFAVVLGEENVVWDAAADGGAGAWAIGGAGVQVMNVKEIEEQFAAGAEVCVMLAENDSPLPHYASARPAAEDVWAQRNSTGHYALVTDTPTWSSPGWLKIPLEVRYAGGGDNAALDTIGFAAGDVVTISGCETLEDNNRAAKIAAVTADAITFDAPSFAAGDEAGAVTITRRVPALDLVCESNNRLFGVCNADKTIYVSALGDPLNWEDFSGLSTDSYQVVTGTPGDFTGIAAYNDAVLFFKRDCVHRLVGDYPAEYAVYVDHIAGVQPGTEKAMVIHNEVLYYKGDEGVYAYTGATPRLISSALGSVRYDRAVAGNDGGTLYFSMRRQDTQEWELLTYDTRQGLWCKEDDTRATGFADLDGKLYMLEGIRLWLLGQGDTDDGAAIEWTATFTPFTETVHQRKYPSRLLLRLELAPGAWAKAELSRDGGPFKLIWSGHDLHTPTVAIPIRPGRCDRYQLRLTGEGRCTIRSMAREFALGGDWR